MAGITTSGWRQFATQLDTVVKGLEEAQRARTDRWVGTSVWWAHFPEFGTAKKAARPYLRPAIRQTAAEFNAGTFLRTSARGALRAGGAAFAVLGAPTTALIEPMAQRVKMLAKQNAERQGVRRTGALIASIEVGRTVEELAQKSRSAAAKTPGGRRP